jgi:hypothetical protein
MVRYNTPNAEDLASVPAGLGSSRIPLSDSAKGAPIYIPKSWTAIHIPDASTALDEIYLWASNYGGEATTIKIAIGSDDGSTASKIITTTITNAQGLYQILPGIPVTKGTNIYGYAGQNSMVNVVGFAMRYYKYNPDSPSSGYHAGTES